MRTMKTLVANAFQARDLLVQQAFGSMLESMMLLELALEPVLREPVRIQNRVPNGIPGEIHDPLAHAAPMGRCVNADYKAIETKQVLQYLASASNKHRRTV